MKKIMLIIFSIAIFSCKKEDAPSPLQTSNEAYVVKTSSSSPYTLRIESSKSFKANNTIASRMTNNTYRYEYHAQRSANVYCYILQGQDLTVSSSMRGVNLTITKGSEIVYTLSDISTSFRYTLIGK